MTRIYSQLIKQSDHPPECGCEVLTSTGVSQGIKVPCSDFCLVNHRCFKPLLPEPHFLLIHRKGCIDIESCCDVYACGLLAVCPILRHSDDAKPGRSEALPRTFLMCPLLLPVKGSVLDLGVTVRKQIPREGAEGHFSALHHLKL